MLLSYKLSKSADHDTQESVSRPWYSRIRTTARSIHKTVSLAWHGWNFAVALTCRPMPLSVDNPFFDLLTSGSVHVLGLPWIVSLPVLVLIAQAISEFTQMAADWLMVVMTMFQVNRFSGCPPESLSPRTYVLCGHFIFCVVSDTSVSWPCVLTAAKCLVLVESAIRSVWVLSCHFFLLVCSVNTSL